MHVVRHRRAAAPPATAPRRPPAARRLRRAALVLGLVVASLVAVGPPPGGAPASAADVYSTDPVRVDMAFPVVGTVRWSDTFLAARGGGTRKHLGQDLVGAKRSPLVAAFDGRVVLRREQASAGYYLSLQAARPDDQGRRWVVNYMHLDNDSPGTDDGRGGPERAYAPGVVEGATVRRGQLLGWLGDSGNAEETVPHLHVELRLGSAFSGPAYNATTSLRAAEVLRAPLGAVQELDGPPRRARRTG